MPTVWKVPIRSAPAEPSRSALQVGLGGAEAVEDPLRMTQHERARLGRTDRRPARAPLQQRHPDDPLERRHLLAQRGLRIAELRRGTCEAALPHDRVERGQMTQPHSQ